MSKPNHENPDQAIDRPDHPSALGVAGLDMSNPDNRKKWLIRYGYNHLLGVSAEEVQRMDPQAGPLRAMLANAQAKFVGAWGREPDGITGPVTESEFAKPRCGYPDHFPPQAGVAKWSDACKNDLKVRAALDGIRGLDVETAEALFYAVWEENVRVCDVGFSRVDDTREAHSWCQMRRLPNGVLAQQFYPTSCNSFPKSGGDYNINVTWNVPLFFTTSLHEEGHKLGLNHGDIDEVMYFRINKRVQHWTPGDIERLVRRYGQPKDSPPPTDRWWDPYRLAHVDGGSFVFAEIRPGQSVTGFELTDPTGRTVEIREVS
jgi:hypothetical protein